MNKKIVSLLMAAVMTASMVACSSSEDKTPDANTDGEKIVVQTITGEKEVPAKVERITTLENNMNDFILALGIVPTATAGSAESGWSYMAEVEVLKEGLEGVQRIGNQSEPNMETILGTEPDVILATGNYTNQESNLERIAPTFLFNNSKSDASAWKSDLREIGKMVGRTEEAEKVIADFEEKATKGAAAIKENIGDKTVMVVRVTAKDVRYYPRTSFPALYNDLQVKMPATEPSNPTKFESIVPQTLIDIDADYMFILNSDQKALDDLKATPIWNEIRAVKEGHIYEVDSSTWLFGYGPIAYDKVLDDALAILAK